MSNHVTHVFQELETDIEIKSKSITKLEADTINSTADFNSSKIELLFLGILTRNLPLRTKMDCHIYELS